MLLLSNNWRKIGLAVIGMTFYCLLFAQKPICGNEVFYRDSISIEKTFEFERVIAQWLGNNALQYRTEIVIPVVVHIVWNKPEENLSDDLVLSQIDALNRDYNAENTDIIKVPDEFYSVIGETGIRFCLAASDPQGNPTIGITRKRTNKLNIGLSDDIFFTASGGSDAWNTNDYLNIWVASTGDLISGLGTYPGQATQEKTGVIVHPKYFSINGHRRYGLGRVATHEVGHYLGLKHTWGDDIDCSTDDEVTDTPPQKMAYIGCPDYPQNGCSSSEMFMNFMDYVDDPCMVMFTKGQKQRIIATINTYRIGLLSSNVGCLIPQNTDDRQLSIYPNPSTGTYTVEFKTGYAGIIKYDLYNSLGNHIAHSERLINNKLYIDLHELSAGIYLIKIGEAVYKLMKI
jgi:Pregnancy-associated plasma protein-A/Secretion system C-terminal sorting domain